MQVTRRKIAMLLAEFLGTAALTTIVLAVSRSQVGVSYFVALGVGLTVAALVMLFGAVSGAHFNPAVTLGMWTIRQIGALKAVSYVAVQLLGAASAYWLYTYLVNTTWTNAGDFSARTLVAESVGTMLFTMGVAAAVYQKFEGTKAAALIGASIAVGVIAASVASAGILNPAVALGVHSWVWGTYVLGPLLGSIIGFNLYALFFAPLNKVKS